MDQQIQRYRQLTQIQSYQTNIHHFILEINFLIWDTKILVMASG